MGIEPTVQIQSVLELPIGNTGVSFSVIILSVIGGLGGFSIANKYSHAFFIWLFSASTRFAQYFSLNF